MQNDLGKMSHEIILNYHKNLRSPLKESKRVQIASLYKHHWLWNIRIIPQNAFKMIKRNMIPHFDR